MRRLLSFLVLAALAVALLGCGEENSLNVKEGEAVDLHDLSYNVRLTRFLTPGDREDSAYLVGKPAPPPGQSYLGVFLRIENKGDRVARPSRSMYLTDTRGNRYQPLFSRSLYALNPNTPIPADSHVPVPGSTAAEGDAGGLLVLFRIPETASADRPLKLVIPAGAERGKVELDI